MSTRHLRARRILAGISAGCVVAAGVAVTLAPPAAAVPGFHLDRLQGADRYATAAAIARDGFTGADVALLANGQSDDPRTARNESHFPDALAGSYLAGFREAPTLLTTETTLPAVTLDALDDIGVNTVIILGGTAAVSASQERQLQSLGYSVQRLGGDSRYDTAAAIARAPGAGNVGTVNGSRTAVVASGVDFPDALVMGPLSYGSRLPLTITDPDRLSPQTQAVLEDFDIARVLIPGGESAVSAAVQREIEALGVSVTRFAGSTRTQTATMAAEYALANLGFVDTHINLALGLRFPDALTGGPHAGRDRAPILLTAGVGTLGTAARGYLESHADTLQNGHIFGGTAAVSASVEADAEEAGQGSGSSPSPAPTGTSSPSPAPTGTSSPSPAPTGTSSPSPAPTGTSSPSPTATATSAPSPSASPAPGTTLSCAGTTALPESTPEDAGDQTTRPELARVDYVGAPFRNDAGTTSTSDDFCQVQVRYTFDELVVGQQPVPSKFTLVGFDSSNRYSGQAAAFEGDGSKILVTFGQSGRSLGEEQLRDVSLAVVDAGAVRDNSQPSQDNPIGDQPLGVQTTRQAFAPGVTTAPDLTAVSSLSGTSYAFDFDEEVVVVDGTGFHLVTSAGRDVTCTGASVSGKRVVVTCLTSTTDPAVRGYVESGTVSDSEQDALPGADGDVNPLQSAALQQEGVTVVPDLVSAEYVSDTEVVFIFDGAVFIGDQTKFQVYEDDATEQQAKSAFRLSETNKVRATFASVVDVVGASVLQGAVIEADGGNRPNQPDEEAVNNPAVAEGPVPGSTDGPDLIAVKIASDSNTVLYEFDEQAVIVDFRKLLLYQEDGTQLSCTAAATSPDAPNTVRCTAYAIGSGTGTRRATSTEIALAVLGTADDGAVQDDGRNPNPEGAEPAEPGTAVVPAA